MVVLVIVVQKNGMPICFDEPIPRVHFKRLVSWNLYNSWRNLKSVGQINLQGTGETLASIPQEHYMVDDLVKELTSNLTENRNKAKIKMKTNTVNSPPLTLFTVISLTQPKTF